MRSQNSVFWKEKLTGFGCGCNRRSHPQHRLLVQVSAFDVLPALNFSINVDLFSVIPLRRPGSAESVHCIVHISREMVYGLA
jgi:hypothetical protein